VTKPLSMTLVTDTAASCDFNEEYVTQQLSIIPAGTQQLSI